MIPYTPGVKENTTEARVMSGIYLREKEKWEAKCQRATERLGKERGGTWDPSPTL